MPRTEPEPQPCLDHPNHVEMWCWEWNEGETMADSWQVCVEECDHPDHQDPTSDCYTG